MSLVERLTSVGGLPTDTEDERIRKGALTIATVLVCALTPLWVTTYLLLDLPLSAAIPFGYLVVSVVSLYVFASTKRYRLFRSVQLTLLLVLPFALAVMSVAVTTSVLAVGAYALARRRTRAGAAP